jgi:hypothetical protein
MSNLNTINLEAIIIKNETQKKFLQNYNSIKKMNVDLYNFKLNMYIDFLKLFKDNKIKCIMYNIDNEYFISVELIHLLSLTHPDKNNIINILKTIFPNLELILDNYINNKLYNYIIKQIIYNNKVINIINVRNLYLNDDILLKLIKSKNLLIDIIKYCGVFNDNSHIYYKNIFKYINFKIIKHNENKLIDEINNLKKIIDTLLEEKNEIKIKLDKILSKNNILSDYNEDLDYYKI